MKPNRTWSSGARALAVRLLAVVVPPAVMLVWLGLQLLQQDRSLLAQRESERRASALQSAVHALEASLATVERQVAAGPLPAGWVRLTFRVDDVVAEPSTALAWLPAPRRMPADDAARFAAIELREFRGEDDEALSTYNSMARDEDPVVRAGGLLRAARVLRKQRRWDGALQAYAGLAETETVSIAGAPADLQARRAACEVLEESRQLDGLSREATHLRADLVAGKWALDEPAWERAVADIERWLGRIEIGEERPLVSRAVDALWKERSRGTWPSNATSGRRLVAVGTAAVTVLWRSQGADTAVLALPPSALRAWSVAAMAPEARAGDRLAILGPDGHLLAGDSSPTQDDVLKATAAVTGLPWTIALAPLPASPFAGDLAARRRLLSLGLAAILMFLGGGSYLLWRVITRELAVVRQQHDFVSAVSHEFRTPLTSLRHVTELLQESDDVPAVRRREFYDALGRNTERLHRLVESLLDFSRMESGKKPYDLQPVDAADLARDIVADFQRDASSRGVTVHVDIEHSVATPIRGDRAALGNAVWNLLDNAVKYSPHSHDVHVSVVRRATGDVAIAVRDEGLGIPAHEQKDVFRRFVRGEQAARRGIKGTGLGLAIVSHIVSAHGGSVELESKEGAGSTFSLVLPALQ
jgi:signal transduction histidine kinase